MPNRIDISPKDRRAIFKRYAAGETPQDISRALSNLGITPAQISRIAYRSGWGRFRKDAASIRKQTAQEVLAEVREDGVRDLKMILEAQKESAVVDAEQLRDSWGLVADPAGASSLMRAKTLHLSRTLRLFGLDQREEPGTSRTNLLAFIVARPANSNSDAGGGAMELNDKPLVEENVHSLTTNQDGEEDEGLEFA